MNISNLDPISLAVVLAALALIPLLLMVCTCFLKMAVVLQLVRSAMGVQQVPPNMVLYGIAIALTIFVMAPVFSQTQKIMLEMDLSLDKTDNLIAIMQEASMPIRQFMSNNASPEVVALFKASAEKVWKEEKMNIEDDSLLILIPAFVISELQAGFEIGFLIYLPFVVIDLIISNLLLALGMQMVAPMTVSLPLKILLFVLVGGWEKLLHSLVLSYL